MKTDILVISDTLLEPPTERLCFRTITMMSSCYYNMDVLLHTTQEMKDYIYNWAKPLGLLDYINYIINENEFEEGVHIDTIGIYPRCIITKYLRIENQSDILRQIKQLAYKV